MNEVLISSLVNELCDIKDISRLHGPANGTVKSLNYLGRKICQ